MSSTSNCTISKVPSHHHSQPQSHSQQLDFDMLTNRRFSPQAGSTAAPSNLVDALLLQHRNTRCQSMSTNMSQSSNHSNHMMGILTRPLPVARSRHIVLTHQLGTEDMVQILDEALAVLDDDSQLSMERNHWVDTHDDYDQYSEDRRRRGRRQ